jgi:hypothetical protein
MVHRYLLMVPLVLPTGFEIGFASIMNVFIYIVCNLFCTKLSCYYQRPLCHSLKLLVTLLNTFRTFSYQLQSMCCGSF